jgi:hypothetical protein
MSTWYWPTTSCTSGGGTSTPGARQHGTVYLSGWVSTLPPTPGDRLRGVDVFETLADHEDTIAAHEDRFLPGVLEDDA